MLKITLFSDTIAIALLDSSFKSISRIKIIGNIVYGYNSCGEQKVAQHLSVLEKRYQDFRKKVPTR